MQGLNIADEGLLYVFKCISVYSGQCFYMLLYFAACVYIFLKADKRWRDIFVYPALVALLTVYDPLLPVIIDHFFDVNDEYYRLLWISPVIPVIAMALVLLTERLGKTAAGRAAYFTAGLLVLIGAGSFVYSEGYTRSFNIYKMPQEVISVSREIHKDSLEAFPKAVCDFYLSMQLRQYDATILLTGTREEYLNMINGTEVDDFIAEQQKHPNRILEVVVKNNEIPEEEFLESMDETNTQYVVIPEESPVVDYLKKAGLKRVARAGSRDIWKYESDKHEEFKLAGYTEVWKGQ